MHVLMLVGGAGLATVLTVGFAEWCGDLVDAGRARSAADAAALAGVTGGREAAQRVAAGNGAVLVSFRSGATGDGSTVTVSVRVGDGRAEARASDAGPGR